MLHFFPVFIFLCFIFRIKWWCNDVMRNVLTLQVYIHFYVTMCFIFDRITQIFNHSFYASFTVFHIVFWLSLGFCWKRTLEWNSLNTCIKGRFKVVCYQSSKTLRSWEFKVFNSWPKLILMRTRFLDLKLQLMTFWRFRLAPCLRDDSISGTDCYKLMALLISNQDTVIVNIETIVSLFYVQLSFP